MLELWPEYNWDVKTSLNICFSWKCFADMYVGPLSTKCSVGERWYRCVLTTTCLKALLYHFCFSSLLTVANINTYESDGRQANTTAAMEQWSSASLPLTGGYMSIYRHTFSHALSKLSLTIAASFFQRSSAWSLPGRLKQVTLKPLHSTHRLWLGKKQCWQFSCLKRTTLTERSGEDWKVSG